MDSFHHSVHIGHHPFPLKHRPFYFEEDIEGNSYSIPLDEKYERDQEDRKKHNIDRMRIKYAIKISIICLFIMNIWLFEVLNMYIMYEVIHYVSRTQYAWINYFLFINILKNFVFASLKLYKYGQNYKVTQNKNC